MKKNRGRQEKEVDGKGSQIHKEKNDRELQGNGTGMAQRFTFRGRQRTADNSKRHAWDKSELSDPC